jgi:ribosomal protein S18 acetylase RimI-like enzyme
MLDTLGWRVYQASDIEALRRFLERDRLYSAYALADLAPRQARYSYWFVAERGAGVEAVVLRFDGYAIPTLHCFGDAEGVGAILSIIPFPTRLFIAALPEHLPVVREAYTFQEEVVMWRMAVNAQAFRPVGGVARRLTGGDIGRLNALYAWGGADFFAAYQLDEGVFYAVEREGLFVAAAGTHVVAPELGIAAVGNVFTHPAWRNRGYATLCTSAVTAELLRIGCTDVVLNVRQTNIPAIRAYRRLGYWEHCAFVEGHASRRGILDRVLRRRG